MKMFFYRHKSGLNNFGDDLNPWLWDKLLPGVFDEDETGVFYGIGTILRYDMKRGRNTIIFGCGAGYGDPPVIDSSFKIYCLRGPLTAKILGVDTKYAITDSAMLLRKFVEPTTSKKWKISFMPHISQIALNRGLFKDVCDGLGMNFIDPCETTDVVLEGINHSSLLITEAMHGAIIADALRVPWIPVRSEPRILSFKWQDWCQSMHLDYIPNKLVPIWTPEEHAGLIPHLRYKVKRRYLKHQLRKVMKEGKPYLSVQKVHEDKIDRLFEALDRFKEDFNSGMFS